MEEFNSDRAADIAKHAKVGTLTEIEAWLRSYHDSLRTFFAAKRMHDDADEEAIDRAEEAMERELWAFGLEPTGARAKETVREPFRKVADRIRNERDVYELIGAGHKTVK